MPDNILDKIDATKPNAPSLADVLTATEGQILQQLAGGQQAVLQCQRTIHALIWGNAGVQGFDAVRPTPAQVIVKLGTAAASLFALGEATAAYLNAIKPGLGDTLPGVPQGYTVTPELADGQPTGRLSVTLSQPE